MEVFLLIVALMFVVTLITGVVWNMTTSPINFVFGWWALEALFKIVGQILLALSDQ